MECPNCHAGNAEGAGYCSSCGTSLTSASAQMNPNFGLAGRGDRFLAAIVDGVIYLVPYILIFAFDPVIGGLLLLAVFVYQIVLPTKDGQTVGKKGTGNTYRENADRGKWRICYKRPAPPHCERYARVNSPLRTGRHPVYFSERPPLHPRYDRGNAGRRGVNTVWFRFSPA